MARALTHCPNCGQVVTPYAAGCAICGTDLEAARARHRARPTAHVPNVRLGDDALRFGIALLLAVAAPLFGVLMACFLAWQLNNERRTTARNLMLAIALLAAVPLVTGVYPWGRFVAGL